MTNIEEIRSKIYKRKEYGIYAFTTSMVKNAVKCGYSNDVERRLNEWKVVYPDMKVIGTWTAEVRKGNERYYFKDFAVHEKLERLGYKNLVKEDFDTNVYYSSEFFNKISNIDNSELDNAILGDIINAIKKNILDFIGNGNFVDFTIYNHNDKIILTDEKPKSLSDWDDLPIQTEVIDKIVDAFSVDSKYLLAAVMRFGKTYVSYRSFNDCGYTNMFVTSGKSESRCEFRKGIFHKSIIPHTVFIEVENGKLYISGDINNVGLSSNMDDYVWHINIEESGIDCPSDMNIIKHLNLKGLRVVFYDNLQDIYERRDSDGNFIRKDIHVDIYGIFWDCIVFDETHFAVRGNTISKSFINSEEKEQYEKECDVRSSISHKKELHLSGTPYRIIQSDEFSKDEISIVKTEDLCKASKEWSLNHIGEDETKNPYFGMPKCNYVALRPSDIIKEKFGVSSISPELISQLFKAEDDKYLLSLLVGIFGNADTEGYLSASKNKEYDMYKHILIACPTDKDAHKLRKLLIKCGVDKYYNIFVAVDDNKYSGARKDKCTSDAVSMNRKLWELEANGEMSITITCSRLLTGATVDLWDTLIFLKGSVSPEVIDQAIGRTFTKCIITDKEGRKHCIKNNVTFIDVSESRVYDIINQRIQFMQNNDYVSQSEAIACLFEYSDFSILGKTFEAITPSNVLAKLSECNRDQFGRLPDCDLECCEMSSDFADLLMEDAKLSKQSDAINSNYSIDRNGDINMPNSIIENGQHNLHGTNDKFDKARKKEARSQMKISIYRLAFMATYIDCDEFEHLNDKHEDKAMIEICNLILKTPSLQECLSDMHISKDTIIRGWKNFAISRERNPFKNEANEEQAWRLIRTIIAWMKDINNSVKQKNFEVYKQYMEKLTLINDGE